MGEDGNYGLRHLMPSLMSGTAALVTALAGLLGALHELGYLAGRAPAATAVVSNKVVHLPPMLSAAVEPKARIEGGASEPSPPTTGAASPQRRLYGGGPVNVEGAWRDGASNCHLIRQVGNKLVVETYDAANGQVRAVGRGAVKGRRVHLKMNNRNRSRLSLSCFRPTMAANWPE